MEFNVGAEHKFPIGLNIKTFESDLFYQTWKNNFTKSISECDQKLLKDIQMFKALKRYIEMFEVNTEIVQKDKKLDKIKDLIYLYNCCTLEYEFTTTANFTTKNNSIKSYHNVLYPEGFYSVDYFQYYYLNYFPTTFKNTMMDKEFDLVMSAHNNDADALRIELKETFDYLTKTFKISFNNNKNSITNLLITIDRTKYKDKLLKQPKYDLNNSESYKFFYYQIDEIVKNYEIEKSASMNKFTKKITNKETYNNIPNKKTPKIDNRKLFDDVSDDDDNQKKITNDDYLFRR